MVRIRLKRFGRRNRPFYRVCVMDQRSARDSTAIEEIGFYDPIEKDDRKALRLDVERAQHWIANGAQPTETVTSLIKRASAAAAEAPA